MSFINDERITPPPGIISAIKTGLDTTANHISIIFFPVILDLFLWLGPQLRMENLLLEAMKQFELFISEYQITGAEVQEFQEIAAALLELKVNFFGLLRTFPLGVSSLMRLSFSSGSPLPQTVVWQINSPLVFFFIIGALTFLGWILGGLYFTWVAKATIRDERQNLRWAAKAIIQSVLLAMLWLAIFLFFGFPVFFVFSIFAQINISLARIGLMFMALFAMWIIVPIFFSSHGIFIKQENLLLSLRSSFHMTRYTLPFSSFFVICVIILSMGFNILWLTPSPDSWMMLIGILGHAFISTALLAASFIYYHDMNIWLEAVLKKLDSETTSAQV